MGGQGRYSLRAAGRTRGFLIVLSCDRDSARPCIATGRHHSAAGSAWVVSMLPRVDRAHSCAPIFWFPPTSGRRLRQPSPRAAARAFHLRERVARREGAATYERVERRTHLSRHTLVSK